MSVIAIGQVFIANLFRTAGAFGDVLAGHLDLEAADRHAARGSIDASSSTSAALAPPPPPLGVGVAAAFAANAKATLGNYQEGGGDATTVRFERPE